MPTNKKSRTLFISDEDWARMVRLSEASGFGSRGVSQYLVKTTTDIEESQNER